MLKKVHKSSENLTAARKPSDECSLCKSCSNGTAFYICDSGHIICENCRQSGGSEKRQDSGDCALEKKRSKHTKKPKSAHLKSAYIQAKDLASGDNDKRSKTPTKETKSKSECKINKCKDHVETRSTSKNKEKEEIETTIEYKNVNYRDDRSSTSSLISNTSKKDVELVAEIPKLLDNHVCPRWYQYLIFKFTGPVQCPVEVCGKMIALDSLMLHFFFDHSKVPRMTLTASTARRLYLKPSNLSEESQCLCVFLLQGNNKVPIAPKSSAEDIRSSDCKSLLLMGAKLRMGKLKHRDEKSVTTPISVPDICTQTELSRRNTSEKNCNIAIKKCEAQKLKAQHQFYDNEMLLFWLCKQDDNADSYSISVLRKDKKQGFNYIGEAIHIRNIQSPAEVFYRFECLMVTGTALNRLLDETMQLSVLVNILD